MASTPKFYGPDNKLRETFSFSTDIATRTFTGVVDPNTVSLLVSIRGGAFTADPDLVMFEGTGFVIPNPSAYPEGLTLLPGGNRIEVKSVLTNGQVTPPGVIEAALALDRDVRALVTAPTGFRAEQLDRQVKLTVTGIDDPNVIGYHFYASTAEGGGLVGYRRVNLSLVSSGDATEVTTGLGELVTDAKVVSNLNDEPLANPLFFKVIGSQTDRSDTELQEDFNQSVEVPETTRHLRTTVTVESVSTTTDYSFIHDRKGSPSSAPPTAPYSEFAAVPDDQPLYYAVTAVYVIDGSEYESPLSQEIVSSPITVTPTVVSLPTVTRQQIVTDLMLAINRSRPDLDVKPGSFTRDVFVDPFSTEAERIRFIIGFLQASQSFTTLLDIDDPTNSNTSIAVNLSPYKLALKQAFFLEGATSVQNLIDNAFDQLASRRGVTRRAGQRAEGEVTFYRTSRPTTTQVLPIGTVILGGVRFQTTSTARLTSSGAGSYNPATGRWSATAFVQAVSAGVEGNVAPGAIRSIESNPPGVQVINNDALFGGKAVETNRELAVRADRALAAVDSGTRYGYVQTAADVAGIQQVNVVDAGHPLMLRDLDPTTGKHWGGKVDVWVRPDPAGRNTSTLTDTLAFRFETVIDGEFVPVGDVQNLKFRATNVNISAENPIIEMLDDAELGFEFKAISGVGAPKVLDLTGVVVLSDDTIQLSTANNDPLSLSMTDLFRGTYRFRTSDRHVFSRQPVNEILSFYKTLEDGTREAVDPAVYRLFHTENPLDMGRSTEAGDFLKVVVPTDGTTPVTIPSGETLTVTGEQHVMLSGPEYLYRLGVNKYTVKVWSLDRTKQYVSPYGSSLTPDFTFIEEDGERPLALVLTSQSDIVNGQEVLIDYRHDENFVVEFTTNALVRVAQNAVDKKRHATADVLVKEALAVGVNISATVVLLQNRNPTAISGLIRTELGRLFGTLGLGAPLRQSDVVQAIERVTGVSYVVIPVVKLCRQDGAVVVRERLLTTELSDWTEITAWSTDAAKAYLLKNPLKWSTVNGGGDSNEFRGVTFNDLPLDLIDGIPLYDGSPFKGVVNSAAIFGSSGTVLPGYTGPTANRVVVILPEGTTPAAGAFHVTYIVSGDTSVQDVEPGATEYLVLGDLDFTFDTDTDYTATLTGRS